MIPRTYPLHHRRNEKVRQYVAERVGVSVEHLMDIVEKRKAYRAARFWRRRGRKRYKMINPMARVQEKSPDEARSGEGEFHVYLRMAGMTMQDFAILTGINHQCVSDWCSWPLYAWPCEFMRMYGWSNAMAKRLRELGVDPEKLKPAIPDKRTRSGRYPRKKDQLQIVAQPDWSPWKNQA